MPGPERLDQVIALLRARDRRGALAGLFQDLVPGQTGPNDDPVAIVWGTPDVDRTVAQLVAPFVPLTRDQLLGGRVVHVRFGRLEMLVEQPDGRAGMAAYVSRYGEGVAAIYLERPGFRPTSLVSHRPPRPLMTPLGRRGWLLPHEWPWGPFVVTLEPRTSA
jgi:hypothetical protein